MEWAIPVGGARGLALPTAMKSEAFSLDKE